jgi:predicted DNA-binding protein YlxM (UPF0122 family)
MTLDEQIAEEQQWVERRLMSRPIQEVADKLGCSRQALYNLQNRKTSLIEMKYGFVLKLKEVLS